MSPQLETSQDASLPSFIREVEGVSEFGQLLLAATFETTDPLIATAAFPSPSLLTLSSGAL